MRGYKYVVSQVVQVHPALLAELVVEAPYPLRGGRETPLLHPVDEHIYLSLFREVVRIGDESASRFNKDEFLPEILYFRIITLALLKEHPKVKQFAEEIMLAYPDYRMIETVEDKYQEALDALAGK